jgi:hypothetical protein
LTRESLCGNINTAKARDWRQIPHPTGSDKNMNIVKNINITEDIKETRFYKEKNNGDFFSTRINVLILVILLVSYLYLSLSTPLSSRSIQLGIDSYIKRIAASLFFSLPLYLSFFLALESYRILILKIRKFTDEDVKKRIRLLARGVFFLTFTLLVGIFASQFRANFFPAIGQRGYEVMTIITNYIYVFGYLLGFYLLYKSSAFKEKKAYGKNWDILTSVMIATFIGAFYSFIIFTNPNRSVPDLEAGIPSTYYLSDFLIFLTIIIPTVIGWIYGILMALNTTDVEGLPSRLTGRYNSWQLLYSLFMILLGSILMHIIISIGVARLFSIGLGYILLLLYGFAFLRLISHILFFQGVKKLKTS